MFIFNLVGARYRTSAEQAEVLKLKQGQRLWLSREPDNPHDPNAIKVISGRDRTDYHIGYVPRHVAAELSPKIASDYYICVVRHTDPLESRPILAVGTEAEQDDLFAPLHKVKDKTRLDFSDEDLDFSDKVPF